MRQLQLTAFVSIVFFCLVIPQSSTTGAEQAKVFRAGAAAIDITPREFPVRVSGSFFERKTSEIKDRLHARCLVLDNGQERIAIAVIDNCVTPRDIFDKAKQLASESTGIPMDRMLMSADHTHSGPALDGLLGSDGNMQYRAWLPEKIAEAVKAAVANLAPAKIGWTVAENVEHTNCRQWIRRPDRIDTDPFGYQTVRSMMHPGYQNPNYLGPAGPADRGLSIISVQSPDNKPIALLANYSMHYFGAEPLSADYYGAFCDKVAGILVTGEAKPPFVGIMSNGTSGDLHWMDYSQPKPKHKNHVAYAEVLAREAVEASKKIEYRYWVPIAMREKTLTLKPRPISDMELARSRKFLDSLKGRKPKTLPELYAMEQVAMSEKPSEFEMKLQAINIGGLGIAAIPCETFGITGLEIKAYSPLTPTFNIELANGYNGYIPPPAQHALGGYTTWRAMSAYLEVQAAPKIVQAILGLLEEVSGKPRRKLTGEDYPFGDYPQAVLASKPVAYWRLNEFDGPSAADASGDKNDGIFEPGVVFYLEGPASQTGGDTKWINRAPQWAGGRMRAYLAGLTDKYAVEMWFSNYLPTDARKVTGHLFAREMTETVRDRKEIAGDRVGIAGKGAEAGKLFFSNGDSGKQIIFGKTAIPLKTWNHLVMVRDGNNINIYLNGAPVAEITGQAPVKFNPQSPELFIGGTNDPAETFEGRIDEVAIYNRALSADEIAGHYRAAAVKP